MAVVFDQTLESPWGQSFVTWSKNNGGSGTCIWGWPPTQTLFGIVTQSWRERLRDDPKERLRRTGAEATPEVFKDNFRNFRIFRLNGNNLSPYKLIPQMGSTYENDTILLTSI